MFYVGGKCSICGEPYDRANKLFEKGGTKYLGKIVQTYIQGQQIDVQIKVNSVSIQEKINQLFKYSYQPIIKGILNFVYVIWIFILILMQHKNV